MSNSNLPTFNEVEAAVKPNREGTVRKWIEDNPAISHEEIIVRLLDAGFIEEPSDDKRIVFKNHKTTMSSLFGLMKSNLKKKKKVLYKEGGKYWIFTNEEFEKLKSEAKETKSNDVPSDELNVEDEVAEG